MEIDKEVQKAWEQYQGCKYCCESGCNNPAHHEKQLMQIAFELGKK